jgi:hypothetical protein
MADTVVAEFNISNVLHPIYNQKYEDWFKWRLTYEGGQRFLQEYLKQFSKSEEKDDFINRKSISYTPAFSKAAVLEVRNSIYQRMADITRKGGSVTYQEAVVGRSDGVDLIGSSMNFFMGTEVLTELLVMGRVGIYIDMPERAGDKLIDNKNIRPYLYIYKAEEIRSWDYDERPVPNEFRSVLLRDYVYQFDEVTHLPMGQIERYRHYWIENNNVFVQFYNLDSKKTDQYGNLSEEPIMIGIKQIPFVMMELNDSLLTDIADYQIAMLNLASADMAYAVGANFPFYVEQFDPRSSSPYFKRPPIITEDNEGVVQEEPAGESENIVVGPASGRRYPLKTNQPAFIHPSPEPMKASMEKQEQLKREIRLLINLAISNIQPKMASAESKGFDERTLESGLSYIGLVLQDAERRIANIWAQYEGDTDVATVHYPEKYNLRDDTDRRKEAGELRTLVPAAPSVTYQKEMCKEIARIMLSAKVSSDVMEAIEKEIDRATISNVDPNVIFQAIDRSILDLDNAAKALNYPKDAVEKAKQDHAERLARIQEAQAPKNTNLTNPASRGIPDLSGNPQQDGKQEKAESRDTTTDSNTTSRVRGPGQSV